LILKDSTYYF